MTGRAEPAVVADAVAGYKRVLQRVLDNRPSGTRQRLAGALGKNRSFVSQIANPAYPTPIPAQHLETIFEVCHFSQEDRRAFLADYGRAHRQRLKLVHGAKRHRTIAVAVPDLGDARRNKAIDDMVADFARKLGRMIEDLG
ncbi:hypothetical protein [Alsobacter sp. R-9]